MRKHILVACIFVLMIALESCRGASYSESLNEPASTLTADDDTKNSIQNNTQDNVEDNIALNDCTGKWICNDSKTEITEEDSVKYEGNGNVDLGVVSGIENQIIVVDFNNCKRMGMDGDYYTTTPYSCSYEYDEVTRTLIRKDSRMKYFKEILVNSTDANNEFMNYFLQNGLDTKFKEESDDIYTIDFYLKFNELYDNETNRILNLIYPLVSTSEAEKLKKEQKDFANWYSDNFILADIDEEIYEKDDMFYGSNGKTELAMASTQVHRSRCIEITRLYYAKADKSALAEPDKNLKQKYLDSIAYAYDLEKKMDESETTIDFNESSFEALTAWDNELNKIYGLLKEKLSKDEMDQLRNEQREWIKTRDNELKKVSKQWEGGSGETLAVNTTNIEITKQRTLELIDIYFDSK